MGKRSETRYPYDPLGQVRKTAPKGAVTRYLYEGNDLLMELDGSGNPIREYTYCPGWTARTAFGASATGARYY